MTSPSEATDFRDPGEVPVLDWLDKSLIDADPLYQRPLDEARVRSILDGFTWRSFAAIVVVPQQDGRYHVTDGQHRLAAALAHPKITHVPAIIVQAEDVPAEAAVFVEINRNRKNVSPLELFFAQIAAGDAEALAVRQVCTRAGVRIPKHPGNFRPGDSVAVNALRGLVTEVGDVRAVSILAALVGAGFAPIKAEHVKALAHLLTDPEFADQIQLEDVAVAVKAIGSAGDAEAKRFAATHCTSVWKGLASVWFQKTRKRRATGASAAAARPASEARADAEPAGGNRAAVAPAAPARTPAQIAAAKAIPADLSSLVRPEIAARAAQVAARTTFTSRLPGDPAPGRSALDQRKASA